jgi:hypothetical protein
MWQASGLTIGAVADFYRMLATFGEAARRRPRRPPTAWSQIAAEDPRECVVLHDAHGAGGRRSSCSTTRSTGYDYAILWRPGRKVVAWSENGHAAAAPRE